MIPIILNKDLKKLNKLTNRMIGNKVLEVVKNDMTRGMLVGEVTARLLLNDTLNRLNDGSYNFKKALLVRVSRVVDRLNIKYKETKSIAVSKEGTMYPVTHRTVVERSDKLDKSKVWFKQAENFQDYVVLKGSNKKLYNNSTELLMAKSEIKLRVKKVNPKYIDLYSVLLYEANKSKITEDLTAYFNRLKEVSKETKLAMGLTYVNYRKLDSNTRNYPLSRYGFSYEYGDKFEKYLVEVEQEYLVDKDEIEGAKEYLKDEYGCKVPSVLYHKSKALVENSLNQLELYNQGKIVEFSITQKELGDHIHIIDVYENIIKNLGNHTRTRVGYDYTNSGGINAANQFGDKKFMTAMNLVGGDEKFDTHQAVADAIGIPRNSAKVVMQGPNHGGGINENMLKTVNSLGGKVFTLEELNQMVDSIFGETYKYINMIALYGKTLAEAGVTKVEILRPDGVIAYWYPYSVNCNVPMEDGTSVSAIMPYKNGIGTSKFMGLAKLV